MCSFLPWIVWKIILIADSRSREKWFYIHVTFYLNLPTNRIIAVIHSYLDMIIAEKNHPPKLFHEKEHDRNASQDLFSQQWGFQREKQKRINMSLFCVTLKKTSHVKMKQKCRNEPLHCMKGDSIYWNWKVPDNLQGIFLTLPHFFFTVSLVGKSNYPHYMDEETDIPRNWELYRLWFSWEKMWTHVC